MTIVAHTDGASRGNPGESGIGIILRDDKGTTLFEGSGYLGKATNNIAEYQALLACLRKAQEFACTKLIVYSDSELMVRQLRREYKVRDRMLQRLYAEATSLLKQAPFTFEINHVAREENREADELANVGIDSRQPLEV